MVQSGAKNTTQGKISARYKRKLLVSDTRVERLYEESLCRLQLNRAVTLSKLHHFRNLRPPVADFSGFGHRGAL